ncbi:hypothetical protein [Streptomyces longispororuber]|uniref:hypothetical protein n=1 Tax=Streptomyces longispororuber TaxID=68230 RepID=UPI0036FC2A02
MSAELSGADLARQALVAVREAAQKNGGARKPKRLRRRRSAQGWITSACAESTFAELACYGSFVVRDHGFDDVRRGLSSASCLRWLA